VSCSPAGADRRELSERHGVSRLGRLRDHVRVTDQPHPHAALGTEPIRTIGRDELKAKLDQGDDFKLIMALNRWAYDSKHIPGSLYFDSPTELYAAVRPEDEVVVYCSNVDCLASVALYRDLVGRGYRNVRRYAGGLMDWEDAGLTLTGSSVGAD
jgi:rhodanese-related sulfurtransferase